MSQESGGQRDRREQVLTKRAASDVGSIADALVIKDDEPFFLCPPDGELPVAGSHGFGLYYHDTRFLAGYELRVAGARLRPLAASAAQGTGAALELTNDDVEVDGSRVAKQRLAVHWRRDLDGDAVELRDTITIQNYETRDLDIPVGLTFSGGFEDVFDVRGLLHAQPGTCKDPRWDGDALRFAYAGADGITRATIVTCDPKPDRRRDTGCDLRIAVGARSERTFTVTVRLEEHVRKGASPVEKRTSDGKHRPTNANEPPDSEGMTVAGGQGWDAWIATDSLALGGVLRRSLEDLRLLRGELGGRRYAMAGLPWFGTLFGRDSLISAMQTLAFNRDVAADTLRLLADRQGTKADDWRDEEPGKILHELRIGELARLDEIPQTPYFGSIDSTPLFLVLLVRHAAWAGTLDLFRELRPHVDAALSWLARALDRNDGYVAYGSDAQKRLVNQGWKDSGDGIVDADGKIPNPPIALAEVQGYAYAAMAGIANLFERDGDGSRADELRRAATDLQARFERDFWCDELGCYLLARTGADDHPCAVVTSNAGQVLWSGIASGDHAAAVVERLLRSDVFNGWGIRTLSSEAVAYWPTGYHLGTVWPHDNALIAEGFRRYGADDAASRILVATVETAMQYPHRRLPECFAGYDREDFGIPVRYPIACHPQAWAAGAVPLMLTSNLGLRPEGLECGLRIERPRLPPFVEHLEIHGLRVGDATTDLVFERTSSGSDVTVTQVNGELDVKVLP